MKLTKEQRDDFQKALDNSDNEAFHRMFDEIAFKRLRKLDPELMADLTEIIDIECFWYS